VELGTELAWWKRNGVEGERDFTNTTNSSLWGAMLGEYPEGELGVFNFKKLLTDSSKANSNPRGNLSFLINDMGL
jgi:hypothetical protein